MTNLKQFKTVEKYFTELLEPINKALSTINK